MRGLTLLPLLLATGAFAGRVNIKRQSPSSVASATVAPSSSSASASSTVTASASISGCDTDANCGTAQVCIHYGHGVAGVCVDAVASSSSSSSVSLLPGYCNTDADCPAGDICDHHSESGPGDCQPALSSSSSSASSTTSSSASVTSSSSSSASASPSVVPFAPCTENSDCPDNRYCAYPYASTKSGFCSPNNCTSTSQCGAAQTCQGNLCAYTSCNAKFGAVCPSGQICQFASDSPDVGVCILNNNGTSSSSSMSSSSMSASSTSSSVAPKPTVGSTCKASVYCPDNSYCLFTDPAAPTGVCAANNCTAAYQCGSDQFCDKNLCTYTFCKASADCGGGGRYCVFRNATATQGYCAYKNSTSSSVSASSTSSAPMPNPTTGSACKASYECPGNDFCLFTDPAAPQGICALKNCTASVQCGSDQFCDYIVKNATTGSCQYQYCKSTADCHNDYKYCSFRVANATQGICLYKSISSSISSAGPTSSVGPSPGPGPSSSGPAPTQPPSSAPPPPASSSNPPTPVSSSVAPPPASSSVSPSPVPNSCDVQYAAVIALLKTLQADVTQIKSDVAAIKDNLGA